VEAPGTRAEKHTLVLPVTCPALASGLVHVALVEMMPNLLVPFHPGLQKYARKSLEKRGVDLRLSTSVKEVHKDGVTLDTGEFLHAGAVIWASGITVHDVVADWNVPQGRGGRIETGYDLRMRGS